MSAVLAAILGAAAVAMFGVVAERRRWARDDKLRADQDAKDERMWLREARVGAYVELLAAATNLVPSTGSPYEPGAGRATKYQQATSDLVAAFARARIVGPDFMQTEFSRLFVTSQTSATAYIQGSEQDRAHVDAQMDKAERAFIEAAQNVLGTGT